MALPPHEIHEPPFNFSEDPDTRKLQEVILELRDILGDVITHPQHVIAGRHHTSFQAAWVEAQPRFTRLAENLDQQDIASQSGYPRKVSLQEAGLTGAPLELKVNLFRQTRDEYHDHSKQEHWQSQPQPQPWWRRFRHSFGAVMKSGNVIVGSTASEIPGGEYVKEMLEAAILGVEMNEENGKTS